MIQKVSSKDIISLNYIIEAEKQLFGDGGVNIWVLQPMAQYQLLYQFLDPNFSAYAILLKDVSHKDKAYLFSYGVIVNKQKQGIGKTFLKELIDELLTMGFNYLELTVSKDNVKAIKLYSNAMTLLSRLSIESCYGIGEDREKLCFQLK